MRRLVPAGKTTQYGTRNRGRRVGGSRCRAVLLAAAVALPAGVASAQEVLEWTVYDLGTLGGLASRAEGINNEGEVVGVSSLFGELTDSPRAFIWMLYENDIFLPTLTKETMYDLNVYANEGLLMECAYDINKDTQIVGGHYVAPPNGGAAIGSIAYSLDPISSPVGLDLWNWGNLGSLQNGQGAIAYALTDAEPPQIPVVVGTFYKLIDNECFPGQIQGNRAASVDFDGTGLFELPRPPDNDGPGSDPSSYGLDIVGPVIAGATSGCGADQFSRNLDVDAVNWSPPVILTEVAAPEHTDWGNYARGTNAAAHSVGWGTEENPADENSGILRATYWDNGGVFDLSEAAPDPVEEYQPDELNLVATYANAISNELLDAEPGTYQAVGIDDNRQRALLWTRDGNGNWIVTDLTRVTDAQQFNFVKLVEATDINDYGWVVGWGLKPNDEVHAFLAVPMDKDDPFPCPWDLNGDGKVDPFDLAILLNSWNKCPGCPADFNGDGLVNAADLSELLGNWGPCPGVSYYPFD